MAQIGDILAKLGRNETLTTAEQQQIRLWGNTQEHNSAFIAGLQNGQSTINVSTIRAISGDFEYPPSGISLRLTAGVILGINNATWTDVSFTNKSYDDASMWDSSSPTVINIKRTGKYQVVSKSRWNPDTGGGYRVLLFTPTVGSIRTIDHYLFSSSGEGGENVLNDEINLTAGSSYKIQVFQTSGGVRDIMQVRFAIRLLRAFDGEN